MDGTSCVGASSRKKTNETRGPMGDRGRHSRRPRANPGGPDRCRPLRPGGTGGSVMAVVVVLDGLLRFLAEEVEFQALAPGQVFLAGLQPGRGPRQPAFGLVAHAEPVLGQRQLEAVRG